MSTKPHTKKALWDKERKVRLTPGFIEALQDLGEAGLDMMKKQGNWNCPELWNWCEIEIGDMANSNFLDITYWANDDKRRPEGMSGNVKIIIT